MFFFPFALYLYRTDLVHFFLNPLNLLNTQGQETAFRLTTMSQSFCALYMNRKCRIILMLVYF